MLFEQHCEGHDDIDWVYKSGDTGQQYFSIVYIDGIQNQWLLYSDSIEKKQEGTFGSLKPRVEKLKVKIRISMIKSKINSMHLKPMLKAKNCVWNLFVIGTISFIPITQNLLWI